MIELKRRFEGFVGEVKKLIPVEASSFREFSNLIENRGVSLVSADVYREHSYGIVQSFFEPYVHGGNSHATVFYGQDREGRKVIFKEYYDIDPKARTQIEKGRVVLRSLITAESRLRRLQRDVPSLKVVIAGHNGLERLPDMDEDTMFALRELSLRHKLEPYPEKMDPSDEELRRMINNTF